MFLTLTACSFPSLLLLAEIRFGASSHSPFFPFFVIYLFRHSKHGVFFDCFSFFLVRRIYPLQANPRSPVFAVFCCCCCCCFASTKVLSPPPPPISVLRQLSRLQFSLSTDFLFFLVTGPSPSFSGTKIPGFKQNGLPLGLSLHRQ